MKKFLVLACVMMLASSAFGAPFVPSLLKISADPVIQYDFDGSELEIPVTITGAPAGLVFSVYTKGMAEDIPVVVNGYLDWHEVNMVDTCVYYAPIKSVQIGATSIVWDGKDQDGGVVAAGDYTYYIWGFDNQGSKLLAFTWKFPTDCQCIIEVDESGLPMAQPIYYNRANRWTLGGDPTDETLLINTSTGGLLPEGWGHRGASMVNPMDHDTVYGQAVNSTSGQGAVVKWTFVAGGDAEVVADWGVEGGMSETFSMIQDGEPGVVADGDYLYTANAPYHQPDPGGDFFILDIDGFLVDQIDITPWWTDPDDAAAEAQMNGGPNDIYIRNGKVFLNCHCSCLTQMVDPIRYLDSGDAQDLVVWGNDNGDYVLDHNFEETSQRPWVCFDFNVGPYTYTVSADDKLFSVVNGYDAGAVTFGLLGPDGTGLGYQAVAGETAGWKRGEILLDSDTPFDGMYLDNMQAGGSHYADYDSSADTNTYFLGHDVIMGVISNTVAVADDAPAAFSVDQNSPNPFNPTTTINFSLAQAGDVTIDVFNVSGQKVDTLVDGFMGAGSHSVVWDASDFSAGVYFYTVESGSHSQTLKMTLIK